MIRRILIANRGEIARRIIRTCQERGIVSVLAHSEADAKAQAVLQADEHVCIGPAQPLRSYLNINAVMGAATAYRCDALHPGYGFLSESPELSAACADNNIQFIGPNAETMHLLGDKIAARQTASEVDVPIIPGSIGAVTVEEAQSKAESLGYPVLLKAAAGGGGRGIRQVDSSEDMKRQYAEATTEAHTAFGDGRLYLEKMLTGMRHVEVQVVGDGKGNGVHLFERDCSLQRRRQKVIEEAPAALVDEATREEIHSAAVRLTEKLNYSGAGTIEFLVKGTEFHFMEMNARLQVEHGITEMITGTDIVSAQIDVASGLGLPWSQNDIHKLGHAIECRITAENPKTGIPCPGTISELILPSGPGVRVDTDLASGSTIPIWYDSLIAKLVTHGETREKAKQRMLRALHETRIQGVETNISFQMHAVKADLFATATI